MSFLIDTDIWSAHLRGVPIVSNRFVQYAGRLHISALTLAELLCWTLRRNCPRKYHQVLLNMLADVAVFNLTADIAWEYGELQSQRMNTGQTIARVDLLIAATALTHNLVMVTHNVAHFSVIPGITVVDWLAP